MKIANNHNQLFLLNIICLFKETVGLGWWLLQGGCARVFETGATKLVPVNAEGMKQSGSGGVKAWIPMTSKAMQIMWGLPSVIKRMEGASCCWFCYIYFF